LEYRNMHKQLYSANDPCTNCVNFGDWDVRNLYGKNRAISPNISTTTEPIFTNVSAMVEAYSLCRLWVDFTTLSSPICSLWSGAVRHSGDQ